jgi:hypothetical protein
MRGLGWRRPPSRIRDCEEYAKSESKNWKRDFVGRQKKGCLCYHRRKAMSREPTRYERELMRSLAFNTLEELIEFLNLPPVDNLRMHPPDTSEGERWDRWIDEQSEKEEKAKEREP